MSGHLVLLCDTVLTRSSLAKAEFATIRDRLINIGARVIDHTARIRIHLPSSCPKPGGSVLGPLYIQRGHPDFYFWELGLSETRTVGAVNFASR
jgi:hypothetical protein